MVSDSEGACGGRPLITFEEEVDPLEEKIAMEDEIEAIKNSCVQISKVINTLKQRTSQPLPQEVEGYISQLKGEMIMFASSPLENKRENSNGEGKATKVNPRHTHYESENSTDRENYGKSSKPGEPRHKKMPASKKFSGYRQKHMPHDSQDSSCDSEMESKSRNKKRDHQSRKLVTHTKRSLEVENSDDSVSGEDYHDGDGHRRKPFLQKPHRPRATIFAAPGVDQTDIVDRLAQALERLDARVVPRPDQFDMQSGQSLESFFNEFETYCAASFRSRPDTWIGELGRCLTGELKGAFDALRGPNDKYSRVRQIAPMVRGLKRTLSIGMQDCIFRN